MAEDAADTSGRRGEAGRSSEMEGVGKGAVVDDVGRLVTVLH